MCAGALADGSDLLRPAAAQPVPGDLVELGFLRGAYGLKGWVHLQPHSGDPEVLRSVRRWWLLPPQAQPHRAAAVAAPAGPLPVTGVREQGGALVAKWSGCDDPETAAQYKGWRVAVARADFPALPAGEYYWVDLIGMEVVNRNDVVLGQVVALRNTGAHDLLEVGVAQGAALLIPVVAAYVDAIEPAARRIRVDWEAGWA